MSYKYISFNLILPNEHRTGKIIFVIVKFQGKTAYMGESEQPIPFLGNDTKPHFDFFKHPEKPVVILSVLFQFQSQISQAEVGSHSIEL